MSGRATAGVADRLLECGNCRRPMQQLMLGGHYGQAVEIDACASCHLIWFDSAESARLPGTSLLQVLQAIAASAREPHEALGRIRCPRCAGALKEVHNRTRWGASLQLECLRQHGAYQTFAQYLSEKGLVRPLSSADRAALLAAGALECLNCGATLGAADEACSYCRSVPGMFDVARLARALDPEGATSGDAVHRTAARADMAECLACGAPIASGQSLRCTQCGATLATGRLSEALAAVGPLEAGLREHQRRPAPHVKAARLARLQGDLDRRREWNRDMQRSADDDLRRGGWSPGEDDAHPVLKRVAGGAALLLLLWTLFRR